VISILFSPLQLVPVPSVRTGPFHSAQPRG